MSASQIATRLKLSERATLSVIYRMAQQGTVRITGVQSMT
jgi:DNA-binding transcriptional regulator LsrR (DeoR family)